ncbi:MAG: CheR family methyltransferase [Candidatus Geothermincolia bacterium]
MTSEERGELDALLAWLKRRAAIDASRYKEGFFRRRLRIRLRALHLDGVRSYLSYLEQEPDEAQLLLEELSISVTQFFRDPGSWQALRRLLSNEVFPAMVERGRTEFRAWSAGCATGEEPYSLAMCLAEARRAKEFERINVKIYATDLDQGGLRVARAGAYQRAPELEGLDAGRYFRQEGGVFRATQELAAMLRFERGDVLEPPRRRFLDLVLCRNLLIYLTREHQEVVIRNLHGSLRQGGYLMLGGSEVLFGPFGKALTAVCRRERIYRKVGELLSEETRAD